MPDKFRTDTFYDRVHKSLLALAAAVLPIPGLSDRVDAAETNISALGQRVDGAETSITALGGRMTTAEGHITTLTSTVSGHGTRIGALETTVTNHGIRITALEAWRAAKATAIAALNANVNLTGITLPLGLGVTLSKSQIEALFNEDRAKINEIAAKLQAREIVA